MTITTECWPITGSFAISRGVKTQAMVVIAELSDGKARGRGECVPYARYGETVESVTKQLEAMRSRLAGGLTRLDLQLAMPAGAARNALDCAFWDLEAKRSGKRVHIMAGLPALQPLITAFTISLATPVEMAKTTEKAASRALLKIKLGAPGDPQRITAVRAAAPKATLIVDANEGWNAGNLADNLSACADANVKLIEQPLPERQDEVLATMRRPIPICADESAHDRSSLPALVGKYDAVNIKLDKAGGLTEALAMAAEAEHHGLTVMAGCMVATSLSMAPAMLLAQKARFVDLDGPLLLAKDRPEGLRYEDTFIYPPLSSLWG
jgi:L-Ala-D/L-Glu epimerase / N-acetyl-D-glutamate racemase